MERLIQQELSKAREVLHTFSEDQKNITDILTAAELMAQSLLQGGQLIACGNGGSLADAMHFAEELTGRYRMTRRPLRAIAISDPAYLTCVANDFGFDQVFSRFVEAFGEPKDVLLAISTSGQSANVINAAKVAKEKGLKVIALTGNDGGMLAGLADVEVRVPHSGSSDRIQELHIKIIHIFIQLIEKMVI